MELTQLKYFLHAAKTQHITRSAAMLHIAQPALTKSLKGLEEELEVPLFAKKGRNIVLTSYGKYLQSRLEPLITAMDEIPREMRKLAEKEKETVRICVLSASMPVTAAVMDYRREHPLVNFQIIQNITDQLYDIRVTTKLSSESLLESEAHIIDEEIFIAVPDIPEYGERNSVNLSEMRERGFISLIGSKQLRVLCDRFCHAAGFEPNIIFESDSPDAARNMIEACLGVGFWPEYAWGTPPKGSIRLLHSSSPSCRRELVISRSRSKGESKRADDFYRYLVSYFESLRKESMK